MPTLSTKSLENEMNRSRLHRTALIALAPVLAATVAACGQDNESAGEMPGMDHGSTGTDHSMHGDMSKTEADARSGLTAEVDGYALRLVKDEVAGGKPGSLAFTVSQPDGEPLTQYELDQTVKLHFYVVRSDLAEFQHIHPTLSDDGTWTAKHTALSPGKWRAYSAFIPGAGPRKGSDLVLSKTFSVAGTFKAVPLPDAAKTATAEGYTVSVSGEPKSGNATTLTIEVQQDGKAVTNLEPYLASYAHVTAVHEGDMQFAHLHPMGEAKASGGGPRLTFHATFPSDENWRLFIQFQTDGELCMVPITVAVG
jgi:hypothetical protein